MTDFTTLHRSALATMSIFVARVARSDLARPTPCTGWTVDDLLTHMVGQQRGFATAVRDGDAPASAFAPVAFSADAWQASVDDVLAAFAGADPDAASTVVDLSGDQPIPNRRVIAAMFLDVVVHTWDLARGLGTDHVPPDDVADAVLAVARSVPDVAKGAGRSFAASLATGPDDSAWAEALRLVGRDPDQRVAA